MSFGSIVGQHNAINVLREYLRQDRLQGGFLLTGPEGIGKKLLAVTAAKALNCLRSEDDSCDECPSCAKIEAGNHPDIHLIENGQDDIKIEEIRRIQRVIGLRSYEARVKVFILDNAHRLNPESSNALLKILEEPPPGSVFLLITDKPQLLFDTVVSRCKRIKCASLPRQELKDYLVRTYGMVEDDAHYAAFFSEGSLGSALRLKETDILRRKNKVIDVFMYPSDEQERAFAAAEREDIRKWCMVLAAWFRDVCLAKAGSSETELINRDRVSDIQRLAKNVSYVQLSGLLRTITESVVYLEQNINTKLLLSNLRVQIRAAV